MRRLLATFLLLASLASIIGTHPGSAGDPRPASPVIALLAGGTPEDLQNLRDTLSKVPGVKFKADEVQYGDFGRDGGLFTRFFTLEMSDLAKTDIGAIARVAANTDQKKPLRPGLFVILRYRPDSVKNEPFRAALAKVKGVQPEKSWAGDANLWVSVDGSGQAKLGEITRALHGARIKFRDPITDTSDQP
jgi:hypothetical protein